MVVHILNITFSTTIKHMSPYQKNYNKTSFYSYLRVFSCLCYPHIPIPHKLSLRSTPCIFLGYPTHKKGYRCINLHINSIIISRHVTFDENIFPFGSFTPTVAPNYSFLDTYDNPNITATKLLFSPFSQHTHSFATQVSENHYQPLMLLYRLPHLLR